MAWSSILPSFLASMVEFVEALTIVLVVGVTINWKSSLLGAGAAALTLAALVAVFGTTLVLFIPIGVLRLVIGTILVLFGMQWLKKALLRYSGLKALHDEAAIYEDEMRELKARGKINPGEFNGFGFLTSFKSVSLEGLEVAFIVVTFGATSSTNRIDGIYAAAMGALLAFLVVVVMGFAVRRPLTKIPENTLKFIVGVMLVTFGTFWAGEGLGIEWPFADLSLLAIVVFYLIFSAVVIKWLRPYGDTRKGGQGGVPSGRDLNMNPLIRILKEVFDFFCGDWRIFWGVTVTLLLVWLIENSQALVYIRTAAGVILIIGVSFSLTIALKCEIA